MIIDQLPTISDVQNSDELPIERGQTTYKTTVGKVVDAVSKIVADEYDNTSTYAVGDYCVYEGTLYVCNTAISTAEEWNASHWTATNVTDEIPSAYNSNPEMDGTASPGSSGSWARGDHVHQADTSRLPVINNAGAHNGIYRGKYLGTSVTADQWSAISDGTFDDLFIGDYWTINSVNYRIAAFDYWLNTGDKNWNDGSGNYTVPYGSTHHVVIVPDAALYNAKMNDTDIVTGAYVGSEMYTTNLSAAKTAVNNAFGSAHVLNHREYLKNATTGNYESAGSWYDSTVELMTEQMVYGGKIFANALQAGNLAAQYTVDKSQLPLFAMEPSRICNRTTWWLRDVASSVDFCRVHSYGSAYLAHASSSYGVRPAFGIVA